MTQLELPKGITVGYPMTNGNELLLIHKQYNIGMRTSTTMVKKDAKEFQREIQAMELVTTL